MRFITRWNKTLILTSFSKAVYLAPKFANQELITIINEIKTMIREPGQKIDSDIAQSAEDLISSGTTLYEESVVGGSVIPDADEVKKNTRTIGWLEHLSSLQLDASTSADSAADDGEKDSDEDAEDFDLEVAQATITSGLEAFSDANYQLADSDLQAALTLVYKLPMKLRQDCEISELQFKLAVCAFHIYSVDDAETALVSVIEAESHSNIEALNLCCAGHLLAQVHIKQGKLDLAYTSCKNALNGRRKLRGNEHITYYESLALLSRICELQMKKDQARIYLRMIPEVVQKSICPPLQDLIVSENSEQTKRKSTPNTIDIPWSNSKELGRFKVKICRVAFSPDSKFLAAETNDSVTLWDPATGLELTRLKKLNEKAVHTLAVSFDSKLIASAEGKEVTLWNTSTGRRVRSLDAEGSTYVNRVAFSPDNRLIVSTHYHISDQRYSLLRISNASTGAEVKRLLGQQGRIKGVAFSPDGTMLVSGSRYGIVLLWDLSAVHEPAEFALQGGAIYDMALSPDGTLVAAALADNTIALWNVNMKAEVKRLRGHKGAAESVAFSPDGRVLVSGSRDRTLRVWNVSTGAELKVIHGHMDVVWSVAFSPDGRLIASGSEDKTARLWDVSSFLPKAP